MDISDIITVLNGVLDLGDQLDNAGSGVQGLSNGKRTTREVCKFELSQFLLYITDGGKYLNSTQSSFVGFVLGDGNSSVPAKIVKDLAKNVNVPDPDNNVTFQVFQQADNMHVQLNRDITMSLVNILVSLYEAFGEIMVELNKTSTAQSRYEKVISQFKAKASLASLDTFSLRGNSHGNSISNDFNVDDDVLIEYTGDDSHVSVPDGITRIYDNAFAFNRSIETILLPSSVTIIAKGAFNFCENLKNINLPEGLTRIESDAFSFCSSLTNIVLPSSVTAIGTGAFQGCTNLESINLPEGITKIESDAFSYCSSLTNVILPNSVTAIGASAFNYCESLKSINLPEGLTEIESNAFCKCDSLTSVEIPRTVDTIGKNAFASCYNIKHVKIPSTLTAINDDTFEACYSLKRVLIYGSKKNDVTIDKVKKHFPGDVKIAWEDDKGNGSIATQPTGKKKSSMIGVNKAENSNSTGKVNERISFTLPEGYEFVDRKDDKGKRRVEIRVNPRISDDGELIYESTFYIIIQTPSGVSASKSALDVIQEKNKEYVVNRRLTSNPEALIIITSNTSSVFGLSLTLISFNLVIALSTQENVLISCFKPIVSNGDDPIQLTLDQLKTVWESMCIDGKRVTAVNMDIKSLMTDREK